MEIEKFTIQPRTHYGYSLPNMVAADAGQWGTHVEISHRYPNGPKKLYSPLINLQANQNNAIRKLKRSFSSLRVKRGDFLGIFYVIVSNGLWSVSKN